MHYIEKPQKLNTESGNTAEKRKICEFCFGGHETDECKKIFERGNFELAVNRIKNSGISIFGEEVIQKLLENYSNDSQKFKQLIDCLLAYYQIYPEAIMQGVDNSGKLLKIKVDKEPIKLDTDSNRYLFRYQLANDDGSFSDSTKIGYLTTMGRLEAVK